MARRKPGKNTPLTPVHQSRQRSQDKAPPNNKRWLPAAAQAWGGAAGKRKDPPQKKKRHAGAAVGKKDPPKKKRHSKGETKFSMVFPQETKKIRKTVRPKKALQKQLAAKKGPPVKQLAKKGPSVKQPPAALHQLQLPSLQRGNEGPVPWLRGVVVDSEAQQQRPSTRTTTHKKRALIPTDNCDPVALQRLSDELLALAHYVRLTSAECAARDALLEHMHHVACKVFGNDPAIHVQDLELEVFGSYACRQVCSFRSDIDVALYGAVFSKESTVRRKDQKDRRKKQKEQEAKEVSSNSATTTTPAVPAEKVVAKAQKVGKWLAAMAAVDEQNMITPDDSEVAHSSDDAAQKKTAVQPSQGEDEMPLFVLDRTGIPQGEEDGKTVDTAITVTESEVSTVAKDDEDYPLEGDVLSDDDTADKLTEGNSLTVRLDDTPSAGVADRILPTASSDSDSDGMEVHISHEELTPASSDFSKRKVLDGLQRYFRGLRNSGMSNTIQLISRARVPIIKMQALLGVEIDCSIGGMNGADTTLYALRMSRQYHSFAPVVLALKVIMGQQKLDTPFSGGLGSYKLYVLVAAHLDRHLRMGGIDDPGEVFLSFAFRYGTIISHQNAHPETRTSITKEDTICCSNGGRADLSNVFLISECRNLFGSLFKRLSPMLRHRGKGSVTPRTSYLVEVIHTTWLNHSRQTNISNAELFLKERREQRSRFVKPRAMKKVSQMLQRESDIPPENRRATHATGSTEQRKRPLIAGNRSKSSKKAKTGGARVVGKDAAVELYAKVHGIQKGED